MHDTIERLNITGDDAASVDEYRTFFSLSHQKLLTQEIGQRIYLAQVV